MAVAYHFFKDFDTTAEVNDRIRSTYDGPLSLAEDCMVWNVTKGDIRVRMAIVNEEVWPPPASEAPEPPDSLLGPDRGWKARRAPTHLRRNQREVRDEREAGKLSPGIAEAEPRIAEERPVSVLRLGLVL